jgi:pentatricopeptide repeat protein
VCRQNLNRMKDAYQKACNDPTALEAALDLALMRLNKDDMCETEAHYIINTFKLAGKPKKCMDAIEQLKLRKVKVGTGHYNAAIAAHARTSLWKDAQSLFEEMGRHGCTSSSKCSARAWLRTPKRTARKRTFSVSEKDTDSLSQGIEFIQQHSAAISACGKGGQWGRALRLLNDMGRAGVRRGAAHYAAAAPCRAGVPRDAIAYAAAIAACAAGAQWAHALRLRHAPRGPRAMIRARPGPGPGPGRTAHAYGAATAACARGGPRGRARRLFDDTRRAAARRRAGAPPHGAAAYAAAISACAAGAQWAYALRPLDAMGRAGPGRGAAAHPAAAAAACGGGTVGGGAWGTRRARACAAVLPPTPPPSPRAAAAA